MSFESESSALAAMFADKRQLAQDAEQPRDEAGKFSAAQHTAASAAHAETANVHRALAKGRDGAHMTAQRDHRTASRLHEHAAAGKPGMAEIAHEGSAAANKSSAKAHRDEPNGTPAIKTPQVPWGPK